MTSGGQGGIRTPGDFRLNGFQDRRNRPLCHLPAVTVLVKTTSYFGLIAVLHAGIVRNLEVRDGLTREFFPRDRTSDDMPARSTFRMDCLRTIRLG